MAPKFSQNRLVLGQKKNAPGVAPTAKKELATFSPSSAAKKKEASAESSDTEGTDEKPSSSNDSDSKNSNSDDLNRSRNSISTDDDDAYGSLDDELSDKSRSTISTDDTFLKGMRSTLPCGLTMTQLMIGVVLVPVIFLVVYTALPLSIAVSAVNFLDKHSGVIDLVMQLTFSLEKERNLVTMTHHDGAINMSEALRLFSTAPADVRTNFSLMSDQTSLAQQLKDQHANFDDVMNQLTPQVLASDMDFKSQVVAILKQLTSDIAKIRQRAFDNTATGSEIRRFYLDQIENIYDVLLRVLKDNRGDPVYNDVMITVLILKIENSFAMTRDCAVALLVGGYAGIDSRKVRLENLQAMNWMLSDVDRDVILMESIGDTAIVDDLHEWRNNDRNYATFNAMVNKIITLHGNSSVIFRSVNAQLSTTAPSDRWTLVTIDNLIEVSEKFLATRRAESVHRMSQIKDARGLRSDATGEILKMVFAIVACIITTILVVVLNVKEQSRMEATLNSTKKLAKAVQRFVPKNQLKMMGVRSIVEVRASLAVEVANTMLSSDIRDFTKLSEEMENLELFEWLQRYVERMTAVVQQEKGFVSMFVGDALHCVFPQPVNAVNAGINMHVSAEQLNIELVAQGIDNLVYLGVGIHSGLVCCCVIGDETRLTPAMIASDVNLSSILESMTKTYGTKIMCSEAVIGQINPENYDFRHLGVAKLGNAEKFHIKIYDVFQADSIKVKSYKEETLEEFEAAVGLIGTDPANAQKMFERLLRVAKSRGIRDYAIEKLLGDLMIKLMHAGNSMYPGLQHVASVSESAIVGDDSNVASSGAHASGTSDPLERRHSSNSQTTSNSPMVNKPPISPKVPGLANSNNNNNTNSKLPTFGAALGNNNNNNSNQQQTKQTSGGVLHAVSSVSVIATDIQSNPGSQGSFTTGGGNPGAPIYYQGQFNTNNNNRNNNGNSSAIPQQTNTSGEGFDRVPSAVLNSKKPSMAPSNTTAAGQRSADHSPKSDAGPAQPIPSSCTEDGDLIERSETITGSNPPATFQVTATAANSNHFNNTNSNFVGSYNNLQASTHNHSGPNNVSNGTEKPINDSGDSQQQNRFAASEKPQPHQHAPPPPNAQAIVSAFGNSAKTNSNSKNEEFNNYVRQGDEKAKRRHKHQDQQQHHQQGNRYSEDDITGVVVNNNNNAVNSNKSRLTKSESTNSFSKHPHYGVATGGGSHNTESSEHESSSRPPPHFVTSAPIDSNSSTLNNNNNNNVATNQSERLQPHHFDNPSVSPDRNQNQSQQPQNQQPKYHFVNPNGTISNPDQVKVVPIRNHQEQHEDSLRSTPTSKKQPIIRTGNKGTAATTKDFHEQGVVISMSNRRTGEDESLASLQLMQGSATSPLRMQSNVVGFGPAIAGASLTSFGQRSTTTVDNTGDSNYYNNNMNNPQQQRQQIYTQVNTHHDDDDEYADGGDANRYQQSQKLFGNTKDPRDQSIGVENPMPSDSDNNTTNSNNNSSHPQQDAYHQHYPQEQQQRQQRQNPFAQNNNNNAGGGVTVVSNLLPNPVIENNNSGSTVSSQNPTLNNNNNNNERESSSTQINHNSASRGASHQSTQPLVSRIQTEGSKKKNQQQQPPRI